MTDFDEILAKIGKSVNAFHNKVPETQKALYREVLEALQKLDVDKGKVKTSAKNLRALNGLKNKLLKLILTPEYKDSVKEYIKSFNEVTTLQNQYWKGVESNFKPPKLLQALKEVTIDDTVSKLTEAGIGVNIGDKIEDILRQNITGGGSYADLTEQLRQHILTTPESVGALDKYAKQITTDALNQYNGQYTQVVTNDLGYEWFKYDNTDIETTRPFCDAMTDIKYFHVSEVPAILRAEGLTYLDKKGERVRVKLYSKTGLPHGMIPGTDASNFFVRRGGYNCGHQIRPVNPSQVPKEIKDRVINTPAYIRFKAQQQVEEKPEAPKVPQPVTKSAVRVNLEKKLAPVLKKMRDAGVDTPGELFDYTTDNIKVKFDRTKRGSFYNPGDKTININSYERENSAYWKQKIAIHEIGHAIHMERGLITAFSRNPKFVEMRNQLKQRLASPVIRRQIEDRLKTNLKRLKDNDYDAAEKLTTVADVLGSLTDGLYGWGHSREYFMGANGFGSDAELFAHGMENIFMKNKNEFYNIHPEMKAVAEELEKGMLEILETIKHQP